MNIGKVERWTQVAMQAAVTQDYHEMSVQIGKRCTSGIFWIICPFPFLGLQGKHQIEVTQRQKASCHELAHLPPI